jgi:hypothetical protein
MFHLLSPNVRLLSFQFPFKFTLPQSIPSSFEGSYGNIRYRMRAIIERPWTYDHEVVTLFTVIHIIDLNVELNLV